MEIDQPPEDKPQCEGLTMGMSGEDQIIKTKQLRKEMDDVIQGIRELPPSFGPDIERRQRPVRHFQFTGLGLIRVDALPEVIARHPRVEVHERSDRLPQRKDGPVPPHIFRLVGQLFVIQSELS